MPRPKKPAPEIFDSEFLKRFDAYCDQLQPILTDFRKFVQDNNAEFLIETEHTGTIKISYRMTNKRSL